VVVCRDMNIIARTAANMQAIAGGLRPILSEIQPEGTSIMALETAEMVSM